MKELSIEEKAHRYDEAIERANNLHKDAVEMENNMTTKTCEIIFPELKESEDERIRKAISDILLIDNDEIREILDANNVLMQDIDAWLEKQGEAWSEEDEYYYGIVQYILNNERVGKADKENASNWFKSIKDRVQPQLKQEWSREDEAFYQRLEQIVCKVDIEAFQGDRDLHSWLKSFRPQSQWKPSDAQMASITCAVRKMKESACYDSELISLFNDLKKLKG